ncbi:MAG: DUF2065 domain-containing protein [Magnetococcales bacterium]|nr:DUF2065 domain-containing protein [Magnetococcales bacterium]
MDDFLTALGLVLIIEGIPYFIAPSSMRQWVVKIAEVPDSGLRQTGFILMTLGLLFIYWIRG